MKDDLPQMIAEAVLYSPFRDVSGEHEKEELPDLSSFEFSKETQLHVTEQTGSSVPDRELEFLSAAQPQDFETIIEESETGILDRFGDIVVRVLQIQNLKGYEDPANTGLPLLIADEKTRAQSLSKNFTVDEFAQSGQGRYKWNYYRVDPNLIKELQILRDALGKPIIIVDGYYPPKYQTEILRLKMTDNPHFSGRGVKIKSHGTSGKVLAEYVLQYCDPELRISVGEDTLAVYIKKNIPRITSYIRDPSSKASVLKHLEEFDRKIRESVIVVHDIRDEDIPRPLVLLSTPVNDYSLTGEKIIEADKAVSEVLAVIDKFMIGKSQTDNTVTYLKSLKNFSKLSDDISKIQGGQKLAELLKNDNSGLDFLGKIQLLKSSLGIMESIAKLSTISEKKKAYENFLQNNTAAKIYISIDYIEGISKLTTDLIGLGFGIAVALTTNPADKLSLLQTAEKFEKVGKGISIFIEGAKIVRNLVSIIILISEGRYSEIKNHLIDIGRSIVVLTTTLKYGSGFVAVATGIYLFYKFYLVTLPGIIGDGVRSIAMGSTITALRELNKEFERITHAFLLVNYNYERVQQFVGSDDLKLAEHTNLQRKLYFNFTWFHRELYSFHKYVSELDYTTRSKSGLYKSFPSIPARVFSKQSLSRIGSNNLILKDFPKRSADFTFVYADALNVYYSIFYEGIVRCFQDMQRIYEERVETAWGRDPFNKETEDSEIELFLSEEGDNSSFEIEEETSQNKSLIPAQTRITAFKLNTFLTPPQNLNASKKNEILVSRSGIDSESILKALGSFIDIDAIRNVMSQYNSNNPRNTYLVNPRTADSVFTEAVHQFQIANYINPKEHDGIAGASTLDTLGLTDNKLKPVLNSSGFYGQKQLNQINADVSKTTGNLYTAANWFNYIVKPSWLGIKISDGIHVLFLEKLRAAEAWLKSQSRYKNLTPAELGRAMGFTAGTGFSGARLSADKQAMHAFGLALDINGWGNPWVGAGWIQNDVELLKERTRFIDALRKASGEQLPGKTIFAYLNHISETSADTSAAYNTLKQKNDEFISYLRSNPSELQYWKNSATFGKRDPLSGFLNLHPDLVYALREIAGLAWGAIDFGPYASGDIMHFDMRMTGAGNIICRHIKGFIPSKNHPAIKSETFAYEDSMDEHHEAIEESEWD